MFALTLHEPAFLLEEADIRTLSSRLTARNTIPNTPLYKMVVQILLKATSHTCIPCIYSVWVIHV